MIFSLNILFEKLSEYVFEVKDESSLSRKYKAFHLLPENDSFYRENMIYLTDSYDMVRFGTFCDAQKAGRHDCLIYVYEKDKEYADGASIYIKTGDELAIVLNRMQEFVIDLITLENELNSLIVQKAPVKALLNKLAPMIDQPFAILDPSLKLLAKEGNIVPEAEPLLHLLNTSSFRDWQNDYSYAICPAAGGGLAADACPTADDHPAAGGSPSADCSPSADGRPQLQILYRIHTSGPVTMLLDCVITGEHYHGSTLSMLHLFVPYIRQSLLQDPEVVRSGLYGGLIADLLYGFVAEEELRIRCRAINLPYQSDYLLFSTDCTADSLPPDILCGKIHFYFPDSMPVVYEDRIIVLLSVTGNRCQILTRMVQLAEETGQQFGMSRSFSSIRQLKDAFVQAEAARRISRKLRNNRFIQRFHIPDPFSFEADCLCDYSDIAEYHAYEIAASQLDYKSFCLPEILSLAERSCEDQTSTVAILYEYLLTGCSYLRTAEKLYMHRNNVVYHITKLKNNGFSSIQDPLYIQKALTTFHILFLMWQEGGK